MNVTNISILAGPLKANGPSSRTFDLTRGLMLRGRKVEVLSSGGPMVTKFVRAGIPIHLHRAARPGRLHALCARSLVEHVREFEPRVIHCRTPLLSPLAARLARTCRCVYVVSIDSRSEADLRIKRSRRFRGIVAGDEIVRGYLVNNRGVAKNAITVIPDGVDIDYAPAPATKGHIPVVGAMAPLRRGEGLEDFIRAAAILAGKIEEIHFVIAGSGPLRRQLRRMVAELGLERSVTFTWTYADYAGVISALDVLVVPTIHDANTRLVLEAVACRKPVVATGTGSLPGIIKDGETGMLVHKGCPEEIADAAGCLISRPETAERIAEEAARWVHERHHLSSMIEHTIDVNDRAANREMA